MAEAVRLTLGEARRLGQGSAHLDADPTYARWIARRISPYASWAICRYTGLSADAVTVASITSGILGGLIVAVGGLASAVVAILLLQLAYLLDVVDGEVARIRGTAGRRGTYLDLIGHFLQNRALYAGAGWLLISRSGDAWWAIVITMAALGLSVPFGHYARIHVLRDTAGGENPDHGPRVAVGRPTQLTPRAVAVWAYRRVSFIWNYPAAMNLFCVALLVDVGRGIAGAPEALAVPATFAVFGPTLALKQVGHALRLLRSTDWRA
jgi:hypothetical protein